MAYDGVAATDRLHVHTDGASRGNPGPAACAYVVSTRGGEVIERDGAFLGEATNNEAEYRAVVAALSRLVDDHAGPVVVHSDSQLMINQLTGDWRLRAENLKPLHRAVRDLADRHGAVEFERVPRENRLIHAADARCNEILDRRQR